MKIKTLIHNIIFIFLLSQPLLFAYHQKGYQYVSPEPGAKQVTRYSRIMVRLNTTSPYHITNLNSFIKVTGSESGTLSGRITIASDKRTIIFKPTSSFFPGEIVEVKLAPHINPENYKSIDSYQFQFEVSESENCTSVQAQNDKFNNHFLLKPESAAPVTGAKITANGVSVPSDFPQFKIRINDNPDQGYIFLNDYTGGRYRMILDSTGSPVWYLSSPGAGTDFKVQQNSILTMWTKNFGEGFFIGLDSNFAVVDSFYAVDGFLTDEHELQLLEDGNYLLIGARNVEVDMSQYVAGGRPDATVKETVIQEFTASGELIFLWSPWNYFNIQDLELEDLTSDYICFPHMNAISIDDDGQILLSSRNLSEITKINRQTGDIIWRLGGAHNQFTFVDDPLDGFSCQHDIRSLWNGRYTVFDNGVLHQHPESRAVEYELDIDNMTATLVWQFKYSPPLLSYWMGNVQRLPSGNTLVNWSIDPTVSLFTEVRPDGNIAFDLWQDTDENPQYYRIFRFPWNGKAKKPYLLVEAAEKITLLFNKFGDADVDYYRIYSGTNPNPTALLDTSKLTLKQFDGFENGKEYYFRVTAVDKNGQESDYSNEVSQVINLVEPGQNMVINGDFSEHSTNWIFNCSYSAYMSIYNGVCHINIEDGGDEEWSVKLCQFNIKMIKGKSYLLEFDAWAEKNRVINVVIENYRNYSKLGLTSLSTRNQHFSYSFVMNEETDLNAQLIFYLGNSNDDVYLDNISLKMVNETTVQQFSAQVLSGYNLIKSYPNPFNTQTTLCFSILEQGHVTIKLYNVLGALVKEINNAIYEKGHHQLKFDGTNLSSGIYFCQLFVQNRNSNKSFSDIHKILLMK
ncbi:aryl-sulfate sulfotransferase [candidate division KSB1 bacterium]|nr:aryl-sulfate sulfotransferase [candidate division KSB1 bacterium]